MRDGPTCLKPLSASRKRIRKRKKKELTFSPFDELLASPPQPTAATKTGTMGEDTIQETPASGPAKPTKAIQTVAMATSKVQEATIKAGKAVRKAKETSIKGPTIPKELIEQYTLSVTPQPGTGFEELEEAIRAIESPCGNVVWSSSWTKKPTRGSGPVTLDIEVIYNDCGHRRTIPYSCRKNRIVHGTTSWDLPPHGETLRMKDVVGHVRGLADLVAACEVVARKSWALNAVSHGGTWRDF